MSVYLISSTELSQLIKFPLFVRHFIEHKAKDSELSLIDFIEMHYAHGDVKDADYDEDMKLPFKSHSLGFGISALSFVSGDNEDFIFRLPDTGEELAFCYQEEFLTSAALSSIWQPPKTC